MPDGNSPDIIETNSETREPEKPTPRKRPLGERLRQAGADFLRAYLERRNDRNQRVADYLGEKFQKTPKG